MCPVHLFYVIYRTTYVCVYVLKIAEECNEAVGSAEALAAELFDGLELQPATKVRTIVKTFITIF